MSDHTLHLSRPAAHVARIEIDAPPMNALGRGLRERFLETLDALEADLDVRALIVTGRGRAFCAGDDLKEARGRGEGAAEGVAHFAVPAGDDASDNRLLLPPEGVCLKADGAVRMFARL